MPNVQGQEFPYTAKGEAQAELARKNTRRRDLENTKPTVTPTQLAQLQPEEDPKIDLERIIQVLMAALGQGQTQRRPMPGMPPQQMQRPGMPPQMPMRPPQRLA